MDHAVRKYVKEKNKEAYVTYYAEILRYLNNNIAKAWGGIEFKKSFNEAKRYKPETRTAQQIKDHVLKALRKVGGGENE